MTKVGALTLSLVPKNCHSSSTGGRNGRRKSCMLPACRSASANDKVGYYYSRHVDRLTCKRLERHTPPSSTVSLPVQGSSAERAGGTASRCASSSRRSEDCICHPGSDMEHITPVGRWSQAESKQNNDEERKLRSARLDAASQSSPNKPAVRLDGTVIIHTHCDVKVTTGRGGHWVGERVVDSVGLWGRVPAELRAR